MAPPPAANLGMDKKRRRNEPASGRKEFYFAFGSGKLLTAAGMAALEAAGLKVLKQ